MRRIPHIVLLLAVLFSIASCDDGGKIIPKKKFAAINAEMFLADQWLKDNGNFRTITDTTLFYEPLFRKYGYSYPDYDATVHHYLDRPDKYGKILEMTVEILQRQKVEVDRITELVKSAREFSQKTFGFVKRDFSTDSLSWENDITLWPYVEPVPEPEPETMTDTLSVESIAPDSVDSLTVQSIEERNAQRRDRIRAHQEQTPGQLPRRQLAPDER